jgi:hypothetical protein
MNILSLVIELVRMGLRILHAALDVLQVLACHLSGQTARCLP